MSTAAPGAVTPLEVAGAVAVGIGGAALAVLVLGGPGLPPLPPGDVLLVSLLLLAAGTVCAVAAGRMADSPARGRALAVVTAWMSLATAVAVGAALVATHALDLPADPGPLPGWPAFWQVTPGLALAMAIQLAALVRRRSSLMVWLLVIEAAALAALWEAVATHAGSLTVETVHGLPQALAATGAELLVLLPWPHAGTGMTLIAALPPAALGTALVLTSLLPTLSRTSEAAAVLTIGVVFLTGAALMAGAGLAWVALLVAALGLLVMVPAGVRGRHWPLCWCGAVLTATATAAAASDMGSPLPAVGALVVAMLVGVAALLLASGLTVSMSAPDAAPAGELTPMAAPTPVITPPDDPRRWAPSYRPPSPPPDTQPGTDAGISRWAPPRDADPHR